MSSSGVKVLNSRSLRLNFYFNKDHIAAPPVDSTTVLKDAIKSNDINKVLELLSSGLNADLPVDPRWDHTPLILATCYGAHRVIPLLLQVCRKKDTANYEGHTALDKGIIYYSLACQHFQHRPSEIERRYTILRTLIRGGCQKVKIPDIELWIKENKRDSGFLRSLVNLLCLSPSYDLKSIGLATFVRLNTDLSYVRQILTSGAGFKYLKMLISPIKEYIFEFPEAISDKLAEVLVKATNNPFIHHQVIKIKATEARKEGKGTIHLKDSLTQLLHQVNCPLPDRYSGLTPMQENMYNQSVAKPKDLKHLCRSTIRNCLRPNVLFGAKYLPLPAKMKDFITLDTSALH